MPIYVNFGWRIISRFYLIFMKLIFIYFLRKQWIKEEMFFHQSYMNWYTTSLVTIFFQILLPYLTWNAGPSLIWNLLLAHLHINHNSSKPFMDSWKTKFIHGRYDYIMGYSSVDVKLTWCAKKECFYFSYFLCGNIL